MMASAWEAGGGIYTKGTTTISNCTIYNCQAVGTLSVPVTNGGGLYVDGGTCTVNNSIFWHNERADGTYVTDLDAQIYTNAGSTTVSYTDTEGTAHTGTGNLSIDPMFEPTPLFNLHLQQGSPCIDAGSNGLLPPDDADLDNNPSTTTLPLDYHSYYVRTHAENSIPMEHDRVRNSVVDMGAIEWCCPHSGDINGDGDIGTDADIELFFQQFGWIDFNCDGDYGTDADIEEFFLVLANPSREPYCR